MSWTRLDDTWTDSPKITELGFQTRWHYLALIQFCSRTKRFDGVLRIADARRCSDVDNPAQELSTLEAAGLITVLSSGQVKLTEIDEHIPPPSVRRNSELSKVRMQRKRKHDNGDHSECLPKHCSKAPVTGDVTRNTRTGQDRTGQALDNQPRNSETFENQEQQNFTTWEVASIPGSGCEAAGCGFAAEAGSRFCVVHEHDEGSFSGQMRSA